MNIPKSDGKILTAREYSEQRKVSNDSRRTTQQGLSVRGHMTSARRMGSRKDSNSTLPAFLNTKSDNMRSTRKDYVGGNNGSLERIEERIPVNHNSAARNSNRRGNVTALKRNTRHGTKKVSPEP